MTKPDEIVSYPDKPRPMTLVISDEAALLVNADTEEGLEARALVDYVMKYGRRAGVGWQASRETADRLPYPLRQLAREFLGPEFCRSFLTAHAPMPGPEFRRSFPHVRTVTRLAGPSPASSGS